MTYFDDKQKRLIGSWINLSQKTDDYYMAYISEWIAFNAICYNLYYDKAVMERANIDRSKSKLIEIQKKLNLSTNISAQNAILESKNDKWNIDLHFPDRLFLSISKRYTEDKIFDLYVSNFSHWYETNTCSENEIFFNDLKKSLTKNVQGVDRHFIINMARIKDYSSSKNIDEMSRQKIILLCEKNELLIIKDVLYQIRCNIFHGEKTPGDVNDDRIVKTALPILKLLVNKLVSDFKIRINQH